MYRKGHVGASLVVYAPFGFLVTALLSIEAGLVGAAGVASTAMVPDLDMRVPVVRHRGITHTVWFALLVGVVLGGVGLAVGLQRGLAEALLFGAAAFLFGAVTIVSHILADALTPTGIRPYAPVRDTEYSLDLFTAANPFANYGLLGLGGVVVAVALVAGEAVPV
ncbi:metal-dependent hydrolase [Halorubrum ezzemoulense]|mgnify:CR=1 FL=1|jgi:inner membrane protein|uniref:Inner membrane protein n=1 Tax=Halorubrum ezzemoulense TaxID=337243 RepID=A0A238WEH1_HALEZ|nr:MULTISPECIES: metal-dependent hydrolase [Halorubrum]MDB2224072.1 metal-dependent hydrolase [Halorubrum ezzemoulense]MDB2240404.1 metal-dependent hydrolase [Halorubrum ezzemoulense]MDB2269430.1 metal-dependent hydrolase [Halorubrum ezzemoulense]MDB2274791.1 metal-dependent hydrolase [Halorubrum ezzemoulense]MDB9251420.1 metal-dependent hydrolase [Halorubrum ezzemoulense]